MIKLKTITAILFSAGIILSFTGCAASSGSLRYHNGSEKTDDNNSGTRFGSKTENKNTPGNVAEPIDTSNIIDGVADSDPDPDEIPVDKKKIDISTLIKKYSAEENNKNLTPKQISAREKILMEIIKYLDTPYKYGGNTEDGIDCSAFTQSVYNKTLAIELQRSAREQYQEGDVVSDKDELQFGDLVFFNTRRRVRPGHVGIYIGDHLFAHASSTNGVKVSSLDEDYYSARFMGGRRIKDITGSNTASVKN
ncbi:MAG: NlpC/P60 family protein [Ignavibacteriaceae bacterium]|nr:NlpC/P60 family protein [Ignavibacteriaceae bacterium]